MKRARSAQEERASRVDPANYRMTLLGEEPIHDRLCYRFRVFPRRASEYLVNGDAWIDAREYTPVRLKGRSSKGLSFWLGRADIDQYFAKFGEFWMPSYNRSVVHVKLAGDAVLVIEYSGYQFDRCGAKPLTPP